MHHNGEIAAICAIQFAGRRPSHHTVKAVLADGPPPSRMSRQFPRYEEIGSPEERRYAVIRLHAQGWSISTIARYLDVPRQTIYEILKRWVDEGSGAIWSTAAPHHGQWRRFSREAIASHL